MGPVNVVALLPAGPVGPGCIPCRTCYSVTVEAGPSILCGPVTPANPELVLVLVPN